MKHPLKDKIVLITGAGRGIGAACAQLFTDQGAQLVLTSRTASELELVKDSLLKKNPKAKILTVVADVSNEIAVRHVFDQALQQMGAVDILINNAGVAHLADFIEMPTGIWDETLAINVRGPFLCSREAFRHMKQAQKNGAIVNLSSLSGIRGTEKFKGWSAYVTSKHAMIGLTESLAVEGKPFGIRVNCVAPGAVQTPMLEKVAPFFKTQTTPEDIAKTILFLSDETQSTRVTGAVIEVYCND